MPRQYLLRFSADRRAETKAALACALRCMTTVQVDSPEAEQIAFYRRKLTALYWELTEPRYTWEDEEELTLFGRCGVLLRRFAGGLPREERRGVIGMAKKLSALMAARGWNGEEEKVGLDCGGRDVDRGSDRPRRPREDAGTVSGLLGRGGVRGTGIPLEVTEIVALIAAAQTILNHEPTREAPFVAVASEWLYAAKKRLEHALHAMAAGDDAEA